MANEVGLLNRANGEINYFEKYKDARDAAVVDPGNYLVQVWINLDEQILLLDGLDIWIAPGRIIDSTGATETILDNDEVYVDPVNCKIYGSGVIKNSYTSESVSTRYEAIKIVNEDSKVSIQCNFVEGMGKEGSTVGGATINVVEAAEFNLKCNKIISHYNSALVVSQCPSLSIICRGNIESGTSNGYNGGTPVININCTGILEASEVKCYGHGSCLKHIGGNLNAKIKNLTTMDSGTTANPVILLDDGDGEQNLVLYFTKIQNLNSIGGDAIKVTEGNAVFIGQKIYSFKGLSLDLSADSNVKCNEIISGTKGVSIHNSSSQLIVIDANYIEGSIGNPGVIYVTNNAHFTLKNSRIKNTSSSSSSVAIYINPGNSIPTIELENVILVTGNLTWGETIYVLTGSEIFYVKNLGLFANKTPMADIIIGTNSNFKIIVDSQIS